MSIHNIKFIQLIWFLVVTSNSIITTPPLFLDVIKFIYKAKLPYSKYFYRLWFKTKKSRWTCLDSTPSRHVLLVDRVDSFTRSNQLTSTSSSGELVKRLDKLILFKLNSPVNLFLYISNSYSRFICCINLWVVVIINYLYKFVKELNPGNSKIRASKLLFVININRI